MATLTLRERKRQQTRAALARATLDLVAVRGIDAVRIDDICAVAEVGRSTFFRYFDSKEASFVAGVYEDRLNAVLSVLEQRPESEGPVAAVCNSFLVLADQWLEQRELLLLDVELRGHSTSILARARAEHTIWASAIAERIQSRFGSTSLSEAKAHMVASAAMTAVALGTEEWLKAGALMSPDEIFKTQFDALAELMGAPE